MKLNIENVHFDFGTILLPTMFLPLWSVRICFSIPYLIWHLFKGKSSSIWPFVSSWVSRSMLKFNTKNNTHKKKKAKQKRTYKIIIKNMQNSSPTKLRPRTRQKTLKDQVLNVNYSGENPLWIEKNGRWFRTMSPIWLYLIFFLFFFFFFLVWFVGCHGNISPFSCLSEVGATMMMTG